MNPKDINPLVALRMQQADETLRIGEMLLGVEGAERSIVNRVYYSAFYAVLALLQTRGLVPKKHQGAISMFDLEFIKTGEFPKSMSDILHYLFRMRLDDDYIRILAIPGSEAEEAYQKGQSFVQSVRRYLTDHGLLTGQEP